MSEDRVSRQERIVEGIRQGRILRIDFLGDSITQGCGFVSRQEGYPDLLLGKMKQLAGHDRFRIYNHAVGGATAADGLGRLHWCERSPCYPDLSFVMFGLNDVHQSVSEADYGGWLGVMMDRLKQIGSEVVLLGPTPYPDREQAVRSFSLRASREAGQAGVKFVDCLVPFYRAGQVPAGMLWADGIHLTARGHAVLAEWIWNRIQAPARGS